MEAMAVVASGDVPGAESWRCAQAGSKSYEGNSDAMDVVVEAFDCGILIGRCVTGSLLGESMAEVWEGATAQRRSDGCTVTGGGWLRLCCNVGCGGERGSRPAAFAGKMQKVVLDRIDRVLERKSVVGRESHESGTAQGPGGGRLMMRWMSSWTVVVTSTAQRAGRRVAGVC